MSIIQVCLGIDIGGTNTVYGFVDKDGKLYDIGSMETRAQEPAGIFFKRLGEELNKFSEELKTRFELAGVGVGAPNANYYSGSVENPPNLKWGTVNLVKEIQKIFNVPVAVTNDANAAALGELKFGIAKKMRNFIEITLGTGLGSGIIVNGDLVYGQDGFAGEMGHIIVVENGRECGCGRRGCLETYASATGIKRTVFQLLAEKNTPSSLRDIPFNQLTSKMIYDAAISGDAIAKAAFRFTGKILGKAFADVAALFSPEAYILYGGLAKAGELIIDPAKEAMEENILCFFKDKVKVLHSGLNEGEVAVLGAAALIWNEIDKYKISYE